jgi:hypothetical protein
MLKMEQHIMENIKKFWKTEIAFYLETSGGQSSNVVHFFNTRVN